VECKEALEKIDRYFENRLNDIEVYKIEKHLENCIECQKEYQEMRRVFDMLSNHPIVLPSGDFTSRIMDEIRTKSNSNRFNTIIMKKWGISFVAAGLLIFVLNTSLGFSTQDISSYIYKGTFTINNKVSTYIKEMPTVFVNSYKKLNVKEVKFFKKH